MKLVYMYAVATKSYASVFAFLCYFAVSPSVVVYSFSLELLPPHGSGMNVTYTIVYCLIQLLKECGVPSIFNVKFKPQCTTSRVEIHRRDDTFQFYLYRASEVSELNMHNYLFYQLFYY